MGLIDKIKQRGRELALVSIAGSLIGCANTEPGPLHPSKLLWQGTTLDSEYQTRQKSMRQSDFTNTEVNANNPDLVFRLAYFNGDLTNDGGIDPCDIEECKKKIIRKSENLGFHIHTNYLRGQPLRFSLYDKKNLREIQSEELVIPDYDRSVTYGLFLHPSEPLNPKGDVIFMKQIFPLEAGDYIATVDVGNIQRIKEFRIVD